MHSGQINAGPIQIVGPGPNKSTIYNVLIR